MKICPENLFLLPALTIGFSLVLAGRVTAQSITNLHSFTGSSDGDLPQAGLILSGNTLYGTALGGGNFGYGTVFAVNTDGTSFTNLYCFTATDQIYYTNSDGAFPIAELTLSSNTLYGTVPDGGRSGDGTVFKVNTDGTDFTNLHSFTATSGPVTNSDGAWPRSRLILSGNTLYGTAPVGGSSGNGTVFKVNTDGTGFATIYSFTARSIFPPYGNSDGSEPHAGLVLSGDTLYGTAAEGGVSHRGTVFKVNTDGTGFTNLHSFTELDQPSNTNSDGAQPQAELVLSGNTLYGTALYGGNSGKGTVFKINIDGTGFTNLYSFAGSPSDGAYPQAGVIFSGNTLYGTTSEGGSSGRGTVFAVNTDGTGFTNLHNFAGSPSDGAYPRAGVIFSGNTLYGTTSEGGSSGRGTIFSLSLGAVSAPQLTIIFSGANVILTWPTNAAGFTMQSATAITGTFTNIPGATSPYTNPITGSQQYFRLIAN
jgi:uncharacterized repeat protein (TIGR03803 family)